MDQSQSRLTFKEKVGYSLGDTASHFVWDMVGFWLLFFYTDVFGISAKAAGIIMLVARFWDAAIDPVVGIISDRTSTKWGKFRPYLLFGALPYAIIAILAFTTPNFGYTGKIIYASITYALLMTAYAFINLPYSSLGAVMSSDTYERAGLNTYRFIAGFGGQFIVTGLALTFAAYFSKVEINTNLMTNPNSGAYISIVNNDSLKYMKNNDFVGIDTLTYSINSKELKDTAKVYIINYETENQKVYFDSLLRIKKQSIQNIALISNRKFPDALADTFYVSKNQEVAFLDIHKNDIITDKPTGYKNTVIVLALLGMIFFFITFKSTKERVHPPLTQVVSIKEDFKSLISNKAWIILASVCIISFIMFAMQNAAVAYYFKYFIGKEENVQLFNVIGTIALIVALPFSRPLAKRFGNKNLFIGSSIISGIFFMLIYLPVAKNLYLIYAFNILAKMAYAPAVPLLWTMIADAADYGEWKSKRRSTGLYFSAAVFAQKAGWGIGAGLVGWLLSQFNYIPNAVQSDAALTGIKLLVSIIPGVLYMSCALFMIFYNIDAKTTEIMKVELEARRNQIENS